MPLNEEELSGVSGGKYTGPVFVYTIQPGDRLNLLARRYGTTLRVLAELNGFTDKDELQIGSSILIPQR